MKLIPLSLHFTDKKTETQRVYEISQDHKSKWGKRRPVQSLFRYAALNFCALGIIIFLNKKETES